MCQFLPCQIQDSVFPLGIRFPTQDWHCVNSLRHFHCVNSLRHFHCVNSLRHFHCVIFIASIFHYYLRQFSLRVFCLASRAHFALEQFKNDSQTNCNGFVLAPLLQAPALRDLNTHHLNGHHITQERKNKKLLRRLLLAFIIFSLAVLLAAPRDDSSFS